MTRSPAASPAATAAKRPDRRKSLISRSCASAAPAHEGRADRPGARDRTCLPHSSRGAGHLGQLARARRRLDRGRAWRGGASDAEGFRDTCPAPPRNLPRSDQSSFDLFGFEGAEEIWESWRDGLTPDPLLTVSEWADKHRFLSPRASAEPGRYRTDRTPYMRAIMDALSPSHPARRIVFMKAAQVGATEASNNWIGYVIHHAPGPMLSVQPTVELAKRFSRQRIEPLIAESPALRERVKPARARDAGNTVLSKEFPAGLLVITGANSAVGLRSMPARYLFLDEVDAYPPSADEEDDPVALAEARTRTFSWRSKAFLASTPTIHGVNGGLIPGQRGGVKAGQWG